MHLIPVIGAIKDGTLVENGKPSTLVLNVMVLVMLAVVFVVMIIKEISDRREND